MIHFFFQHLHLTNLFILSLKPCNVPNYQAVAGIWDLAVNIGNVLENEITGTDWIKRISEHIKQITAGKVDLENRESNSQWVQTVLGKLDFNLARHCWVTYSKRDKLYSNHYSGSDAPFHCLAFYFTSISILSLRKPVLVEQAIC